MPGVRQPLFLSHGGDKGQCGMKDRDFGVCGAALEVYLSYSLCCCLWASVFPSVKWG